MGCIETKQQQRSGNEDHGLASSRGAHQANNVVHDARTSRKNSTSSMDKKELRDKYDELERISKKKDLELQKNKKQLDAVTRDLNDSKYAHSKEIKTLQEKCNKLDVDCKQLGKKQDEQTHKSYQLDEKYNSKSKENLNLQNQIKQLKSDLKNKDEKMVMEIETRDRTIEELKLQIDNGKRLAPTPPVRKNIPDRQRSLENKPSKLPISNFKQKNFMSEINDKVEHESNPFKLKEMNQKLVDELMKAKEENNKLAYEYNALQKTSQSQQNKLQIEKMQKEIKDLKYSLKNRDIQILQHENEAKVAVEQYEKEIVDLKKQLAEKKMSQAEQQDFNEKTDDSTPNQRYINESLQKIQLIFDDSKNYEKEVLAFRGTAQDKNYLHLEEMLIRNLVKLDNVESEGNTEIRKERKIVLQFVQTCLDDLKKKVNVNTKTEEPTKQSSNVNGISI